jgi:hypothetical protein
MFKAVRAGKRNAIVRWKAVVVALVPDRRWGAQESDLVAIRLGFAIIHFDYLPDARTEARPMSEPLSPHPSHEPGDRIRPPLGDETLPPSEPGPLDFQDPTAPVVAGYVVEEELGRGGMGVVYKARQTRLNRSVALKMILSGAQAGPVERARFRVEAESVAQLQHPNIVQIYDVGEADGRPDPVPRRASPPTLGSPTDLERAFLTSESQVLTCPPLTRSAWAERMGQSCTTRFRVQTL